jgi:Putative beta barrel porin-7 (BBP7)
MTPSAGARFTAGHWLDPAHNWAVDVEGFFPGNRNAGFSEASGANGSPALRVPFTNVAPGGAGFPVGSSSFVLADGGFATGSQVIGASLQLWGVEDHLGQRGPFDVTLLGGLRYLDLREGLNIVSNETLLPGALGAPGSFTATDGFSTRNQFFGAQIGAKAQAQMGRFDGLLLAKVALGDNYETVGVSGSSVVSAFGGVFPTGGGVFPGGIFAQATNIGQQSRSQFAAVPEVQAQLGYRLPFGVRAFVGYDMIFVSNVVRPGNRSWDQPGRRICGCCAAGAHVQQLVVLGAGHQFRGELHLLSPAAGLPSRGSEARTLRRGPSTASVAFLGDGRQRPRAPSPAARGRMSHPRPLPLG